MLSQLNTCGWVERVCWCIGNALPEMLTVGSPLSNIQQSPHFDRKRARITDSGAHLHCRSMVGKAVKFMLHQDQPHSLSKAKRLSPLSIDTVRVTKQVIADRKDEMQHTARDIHAMTNSCLPGNALSQRTARTCDAPVATSPEDVGVRMV